MGSLVFANYFNEYQLAQKFLLLKFVCSSYVVIVVLTLHIILLYITLYNTK